MDNNMTGGLQDDSSVFALDSAGVTQTQPQNISPYPTITPIAPGQQMPEPQMSQMQIADAPIADSVPTPLAPQPVQMPFVVQDQPSIATPTPLVPTIDTPQQPPQPVAPATGSDLESVKQQALSGLIPLVDTLDQQPEDRFKTIMMIVQASDKSELVPKALEAAQSISDTHVRAQALLDIVNEVNYFTKANQ
jgi:hypothetical protein